MSENKLVIDARGDACPIPVVKTLKALGALAGPGEVETIVDNKVAVENLTRMASSKGCERGRADGREGVARHDDGV